MAVRQIRCKRKCNFVFNDATRGKIIFRNLLTTKAKYFSFFFFLSLLMLTLAIFLSGTITVESPHCSCNRWQRTWLHYRSPPLVCCGCSFTASSAVFPPDSELLRWEEVKNNTEEAGDWNWTTVFSARLGKDTRKRKLGPLCVRSNIHVTQWTEWSHQ